MNQTLLDNSISWVQERVTAKRFEHIKGVAQAGEYIASKLPLDLDKDKIALACWLHDSCKELKASELVLQAKRFGLNPSKFEEENGHLLHGPVAAMTVKEKWNIDDKDILEGIAEHTLGMAPMSLFSQVVYLADALEQSRPFDFVMPIWNELGLVPYFESNNSLALDITKKEAELCLAKAMLKASDASIDHLLKVQKPIHPRAVDVRNYFLAKVKAP